MNKEILTILGALNNQIDSNELTQALKEDKWEGEYALTEEGVASILDQTKGLLSKDSAVNNPEIIEKISKDLYPKHMKTALSKVEEGLKPIMDKLGVDYSQYEFVSDAIKDIEPRLEKMGEGDNKELVASLNEDLRKSKELLQQQAEEFEAELKKRDEGIIQDKLRQVFISKATEKPWAEAYNIPDVKDAILGKVWDKLNSKAYLKLSEDGEIIPMQKDFPDKELYDGNKVMTFQSLLEPEFEPFLKKSDPKGGDQPPAPEGQLSEAEKKRIAEYKRQKEVFG